MERMCGFCGCVYELGRKRECVKNTRERGERETKRICFDERLESVLLRGMFVCVWVGVGVRAWTPWIIPSACFPCPQEAEEKAKLTAVEKALQEERANSEAAIKALQEERANSEAAIKALLVAKRKAAEKALQERANREVGLLLAAEEKAKREAEERARPV